MSSRRARPGDADAAMTRESACAALGIPPWATESDARRAYRSLAGRFIDKGGDVACSRRCSARTSTCPARVGSRRRRRSTTTTLVHRPPPSARPDPVASSSDVTPARDPADLGDDAFAAGDFSRAVDVTTSPSPPRTTPACFSLVVAPSPRSSDGPPRSATPIAPPPAEASGSRRGSSAARASSLSGDGAPRARCYRDASRLPEAPKTRAHVTSTRVADDIDADAKPGSEGSRVGEGEGEGEGEPSSRVGSRPRAAADEIREGLRRAVARRSRRETPSPRRAATPVQSPPSRSHPRVCGISRRRSRPGHRVRGRDSSTVARGERSVASGRDRTRRRRDERGFGDDRVGGRSRRPGLGDERVVGRARGGRRARPRRRHRLRRARLTARRETRVRGARRRIGIVVFPRLSRDSTLAARRPSLFARVGRVGSSRRRGPRRRYRSGVVRGDGRGVRLADASPRGDGIVGGVHPAGWQLCSGGGAGDGVGKVWDLAGMTGRAPGSCAHTLRWDAGAVTRVSYAPCGRLIVTATAAPVTRRGTRRRFGLLAPGR